MMADRKIEIDWKSRSGSIGVWNVEDKLSSWRIQKWLDPNSGWTSKRSIPQEEEPYNAQ